MTTTSQNTATEPVVFQSTYGSFQPRFLWLLPLPGIVGLIGIPVGIFYNEGWEMSGHPLEPWSATLIIEILSVGAVLTVAAAFIGTRIRRKSPQRVVLTESSLVVPKSTFSKVEFVLPLSEISLSVFNMGFVKQLQIKHKRRKVLLSSAMFPTTADFDRLVGCLLE